MVSTHSCQVTSVVNDVGDGAKVVAHKHGLLPGARITFRGMPALQDVLGHSTFIVTRLDCHDHAPQDAFWIGKEVRSPISCIRSGEGIVETAEPHGVRKWANCVQLVGLEGEGSELINCKSFKVISGEKCCIHLGEYREVAHNSFQVMPVSLPHGLRGGFVIAEPQAVDLSNKPQVLGGEVLTQPIAKDTPECVKDWKGALTAVFESPVAPSKIAAVEPEEVADNVLLVGLCGSGCEGEYQRRETGEHRRGAAFIILVPDLGLWCLMADLQPTYPLDKWRRKLGLDSSWEGPQLLYVCRGCTPFHPWEPVLGRYPAPVVRAAHSTPPCFGPSATSAPAFFYWEADFGAALMGMLFSPREVRSKHIERCPSALEMARFFIAGVAQTLCASVAVCKAWHFYLRCVRTSAIVQQAAQLLTVNAGLISEKEAARILTLDFSQSCFDSPRLASFAVLEAPLFRMMAWGACIKNVEIGAALPPGTESLGGPVAEMINVLAPIFFLIARDLFQGIPLAWSQSFTANKISRSHNGTSMCYCSLIDDLFIDCDVSQQQPGLLCRVGSEGNSSELQTLAGQSVLSQADLDKALHTLQKSMQKLLPDVFVTKVVFHSGWSLSQGWQELMERSCPTCTFETEWSNLCRECWRKHAVSHTKLHATQSIVFQIEGGVATEVVLDVSSECVPFYLSGKDAFMGFDDLKEAFSDHESEVGEVSISDSELTEEESEDGEEQEEDE